jgi:hypothetical protein
LAKSHAKYDSPSAQIIKNHENLPAAGKSAFHIIVPILKRIVIEKLNSLHFNFTLPQDSFSSGFQDASGSV